MTIPAGDEHRSPVTGRGWHAAPEKDGQACQPRNLVVPPPERAASLFLSQADGAHSSSWAPCPSILPSGAGIAVDRSFSFFSDETGRDGRSDEMACTVFSAWALSSRVAGGRSPIRAESTGLSRPAGDCFRDQTRPRGTTPCSADMGGPRGEGMPPRQAFWERCEFMEAATTRRWALTVAALTILSFTGCAGWRMYKLHPECVPNLLYDAERTEKVKLNFLQLRQDPPKAYFLGPGDVLGVYIEGIVGSEAEPPPVHFPEDESQKPAIGYPMPVRDDGRISLPMVEAIYVSGATVAEAEQRIRDAYVGAGILKPERARIIVTLMRKRKYNILVIREDTESISLTGGGGGLLMGSTKKGKTYSIHLPAYENDVLHALSETGGLPGEDAKNEVIILRGAFADAQQMPYLLKQLEDEEGRKQLLAGDKVTRIPIRIGPNDPVPHITEQDIILHDGDVVLIESRETEVFYTGGLLQGGQHPLPRDYDIDVLDAIAIAGGSLATAPGGQSGSIISSRFGGGNWGATVFPATDCRIIRRIGTQQYQIPINLAKAVSGNDPTQRVIIQPGDVIILQYRPHEIILNTVMNLIDSATFGLFGFWSR
ncbi:MAG TPA: hypothetical protein EYP14_00130 [Planctomycetaceae bacterium]|nr:hypothetical protein [Planctomycetaceae bacterium]